MFYPNLMFIADVIHSLLHFLHLFIHIHKICILTTPFFTSNTTFVANFFAKKV